MFSIHSLFLSFFEWIFVFTTPIRTIFQEKCFNPGKKSYLFWQLKQSAYICRENEDRLHLSIKNERVHFIIHSVCTVFAPDKTKKVNENNVSKYILVVALFTTHKVVRNQSSCIYYHDIIKGLSHLRQAFFRLGQLTRFEKTKNK